jgi:hypothetical protein
MFMDCHHETLVFRLIGESTVPVPLFDGQLALGGPWAFSQNNKLDAAAPDMLARKKTSISGRGIQTI